MCDQTSEIRHQQTSRAPTNLEGSSKALGWQMNPSSPGFFKPLHRKYRVSGGFRNRIHKN